MRAVTIRLKVGAQAPGHNDAGTGKAMQFSLVLIGAHNGSKLAEMIAGARGAGNVLLVEPVPFLFRQLEQQFAGQPGVHLRNVCISTSDGKARFTAPLPSATSVAAYGDQLGSLLPDHAVNHLGEMAGHLETIEVESRTFETLIAEVGITAIDMLYCDTEGMDVPLLELYPFEKVPPAALIFEFKHADGTFRVGRKLGHFLIRLDDMGYRAKVLDIENILAERIAEAQAGQPLKNASRPGAGKLARMLQILFEK